MSADTSLLPLHDTLASQQKRHHWDKRKRRYIQLQPNEEVKAGKRMRTESGARGVSEDAPSGLYQKWAKANKRHVVRGAQEDSSAAAYSKDLANRYSARELPHQVGKAQSLCGQQHAMSSLPSAIIL